jgi:S-adenosylmethionine/arginine decarboxylase-like enzyme
MGSPYIINKRFWGKLASIDLVGCNEKIMQPKEIRKFCDELCKKINMKKYGPTYLKRFGVGKLEGYSFMQFIETSSITAHFEEQQSPKKAFIDIFSCKDFNENKAKEYCKEFFGANKVKMKVLIRE